MTCEEFLARLTAFGLGELEGAEVTAAREHVTHCNPCASRVLLDRQLTGLLRASVVQAPPELHDTVVAAVRAEAARAAARKPDHQPAGAPPRPTQRERERRRHGRRRHWGVLGVAASMAVVVAAVLLLAVPAPNANATLAAAWTTYRSGTPLTGGDTHRLVAVFGSTASGPDLRALGLEQTGTGARMIANHLTAISEYRDQGGKRITLMRWKGKLPRLDGADQGQGAQTASWDATTSVWWLENGVVYCAIGEVDQHTLMQVADRLELEHGRGES
jgi:hypothetical protein